MAAKYTKKQLADMVRSQPNAEAYKGLDDNAIFERVVAARPEVKTWVQEEAPPAPQPGKFQQFKDLARQGFDRLTGKEAGPAYDVRQAQPPKLEVGGYELAGNLQAGSAETMQRMEEPEAAAALRRGQQAVAAVGTGALKTAEFGASLANAMVGTAMPFNWEASKRQWQRVSELGEAAPLEEISNVLGSALIVYGGYEGLKAAPALYNLARNSNLMRRLRIPERGLATIPDEQMYRIYQTAPDEVKKEMATYNPQVRSLLLDPAKVERFSAPRAARPAPVAPMAAPAAAAPAASRPAALPAIALQPPAAPVPTPAAAAPAAAPAAIRGSMLPAELQEQYRRNQVAVLEEIIARGEIKPQEISDLVFDKAKDGITLRTILERKMIELPGQHEVAVKQAADEYAAFLKGVKMTSEAQAPAAAPAMPAATPTPAAPAPAMDLPPAMPTRETIWNMPLEKLQPIILKEGWEAPPWKPAPEVARDMQLYPEGEAYRKWKAETEIFNRGSKHRVPPELVEKYNLYDELNLAIDREIAERQEQIQAYIDRRGGVATPYWTATKRLGFINKNKLMRWLQIETGRDWKGREFPEELAWVVRDNGEMSVEGMTEELFKLGVLPDNDPQLYVDGLMQDWKYKQAEKTGRVFEDVVNKPRDMVQTGIEGEFRKRAPAIDLPGQQMIPGTGPAMPSTKIVREININPDDFVEGFTAQPEQQDLFQALEEAAAANKESKPVKPGAAEAVGAAPRIDTTPEPAAFQPPTGDKEFKLWRAIEWLIEKYAKRYGEDKYRPSGAIGVYYPGTKNIFLQAANNVFVAVHEITHYADTKTKWFETLAKVVGTSKDGAPIYDPATLPMRRLVTQFYNEYYPGASKSAPLRKRMREGVAMMMEKAAEMPEITKSGQWKELYDMVITPGGKYYNPTFKELVDDARFVMDQYRQLDPLSKTAARISAADRKRNVDTLFTTMDRIKEREFDDLHKFEVMSKRMGLTNTPMDPYNALQAIKYVGAIQNNALEAGKGMLIPTAKGTLLKKEKNVGDLFELIKDSKQAVRVDAWLIARRVHAGYQKMDALREKITAITGGAYDIEAPNPAALRGWLATMKLNTPPDELKAAIQELRAAAKEYSEIAAIAKNDNISRDVAQQGYEQGLAELKNIQQIADLHDNVNMTIVDMYVDAGIISSARGAVLKENKAYASFRRDILTIHTGDGQPVKLPSASMGLFKQRVGSELAFEGPLYGLIQNLNEAFKNTAVQHAKNKIYDMTLKDPEFFGAAFQPVDLTVRIEKDGKIEYPQLKNPKIIMARKDGKYYPLVVEDLDLLEVLNGNLINPGVTEGLEKFVKASARVFTKGTTGLYLPFSVVNFFMLDPISAMVQTQTNYVPFWDQARTALRIALNSQGPEAEYFTEYLKLTGGRQSLAHMYDENRTVEQAYRYLTKDMKAKDKVLNAAENVLDVVAGPAKMSEDLTRGQEYVNARLAGYDIFTALEMAARVSGSFSHHGTEGGPLGRLWVRSVPYWNPAKQVIARQVAAATDEKGRKRLIIAIGALTAAMIYSSHAIRQASPAQRRNLRGKHPKERASAIWYPWPTAEGRRAGRLGRWRVPEQLGAVANLVNMVIEESVSETNYKAGEWVDAATAFIPDQYNVLSWSRFLFSRMPWIVQPAVQISVGKKVYPKVVEMTPRELTGLPIAERATENTSAIAKKISENIGEELNLNPIEVDFLIEGYMGGRSTRFVTGRLGWRNITNNFYLDLYIGATRDMESYYKIKEMMEQQTNLFRRDLKAAAAEQRAQQLFPEDASASELTELAINAGVKGVKPSDELRRMMRFKPLVNKVQGQLTRYRFLMRVKDPTPGAQAEIYDLRDDILDSVDMLNQEYDKALDKK